MCGIAAIVSLNRAELKSIAKMSDLIVHRGPDGQGEELFLRTAPYVALAHRRLAIIDLTHSGHQPMCLKNSSLYITFNGEIYNYLEIKKELEALGDTFTTHTDTEVILAAYRRYGASCLHKFNGMFAFVIYNDANGQFFAARDRFGVKPLYFWQTQNTIAFASEIKQFSSLPGWRAKLNPQRAYDYLNFAVLDHTHETLFDGVFQFKGGEYWEGSVQELLKNPLHPKRWYELSETRFEGSYEEAVDQFRNLFNSSIELRLRSDVSIGSCLSGGLDSSSIVCEANRQLKEKCPDLAQTSFTASSEHLQYDETVFAKHVIEKTGVKGHFTIPTLKNLFTHLKTLSWHQDEPFISSSIFAQWSVFQLANLHQIKVMLDGQGADEQLGGYLGFFANHLYDLVKEKKLKKAFSTWKQIRHHHPHHPVLKQLGAKFLPKKWNLAMRRLTHKNSTAPTWLNLSLLGAADIPPFIRNHERSFRDESRHQLFKASVPMLLHFEDRNSMAHGIESRTPFLDFRLVEFLASLPAEFKVGQGATKQILRDAMKSELPKTIVNRHDKMGFLTSEEVWLKGEGKQLFLKALLKSINSSKGILNEKLMQEAHQIIEGKRPFSYTIWRAISFGAWIDAFDIQLY